MLAELLCYDCKTILCVKCAPDGSHKDHQTDDVNEFMMKMNKKRVDSEKLATENVQTVA